jgi:anti-sigma regulatory factor (Ser/Thr protein kinase)
VEPTGRVLGAKPRTGHPIEITLPCEAQALKAFQQLVATLPTWSGYTDLERARLESVIAEICGTIHQKAYDGNEDSTFQVLVLCRGDELVMRFADHGKPLSAAAFPTATQYMTEFEHRPHPAKGNFLKMAKRVAKG